MRPLRTLQILALALVPLFAGCGDDKPQKPPEPPAAVYQAKAAPIGEIVAPAQVIAWGGADDLDKLSAGVTAFVQQIAPIVPPALDLVREQLRQRMALTKVDGIDWKKPARMAIFDPKGMPKAQYAVALTLASKDALLATLPPTKKERDEGNAITYRDDLGRTVCLNFIDQSVVITWEKKQFEPNAELFAALVRSTVPEGQSFHLSAKNVSALYSKDIDEAVALARQQMVQSPMGVPGVQSEVSQRVLTWMVTTFKDLERIEALPRLTEDGVLLSLRLHPKEGSELSKSFKAIEPRPHTLLAKLPADAPMFASFSTNPDSADGLTTRLVEWAMSVGFGGKVPEGYAQAMKDYFQSTGGEMAVAVHKPLAGDGLALTTVMTVRDETKLRDAMRKSKDTLKSKEMQEVYKNAGVAIDYRVNAYKVGPVPVDSVEVKFDKGKNPMAQLGPFGDAMGEFSNNQTAVAKDFAIIGYGKDARKTIEAFFGGKMPGGLDKAAGVARAFKYGVKDPVGVFYISPVEMAKRAALGGKNPLAASLQDLASTDGVALSFSAKDGVLELVVDVPTDQAKNIAQAAGRARALFPQ